METTDLFFICSQSYSLNLTFRDGLKEHLQKERMQAPCLRGKVCEQRTMAATPPRPGQRLGTGTMHSKSKASACTLYWRQVLSRQVGSRLALTLCVMDCFDLNFQHFYEAPQQVGGSREKMVCLGFPKPWEKASKIKDCKEDMDYLFAVGVRPAY